MIKNEEKVKYLPPSVNIVLLEFKDVIATSTPLQNPDLDDGGWTKWS